MHDAQEFHTYTGTTQDVKRAAVDLSVFSNVGRASCRTNGIRAKMPYSIFSTHLRPQRMSGDEVSVGVQQSLNQQAERIAKLRSSSNLVMPKHLDRALLDSPIKSFYELSRVSATRSYLRFFAESREWDEVDLPVIGELVHDWAVTGQIRSQGAIAVLPSSGSIMLLSDEPESAGLDVIASSATTFRAIFESFVEFRNEVCKLKYDEFGVDTLSDADEATHLELIRKFWTFVAQTDPIVLDSGSQFWSRLTKDALTWVD